MIDVHCHLLPGIDDGPKSPEESLSLARYAVEHGITKSVVTPHIHVGRYQNARESITQACDEFRRALEENRIPLEIGFAAEVRIGIEIIPMIESGSIPFLGKHNGLDVLLLEFPHSHVPPGSDKLINWLFQHNICPLIAHPERNKGIMSNYQKIEPLIELGCILQVTAGSVTGQFGKEAMHCAEFLLRKGYVTLLASDAHNLKHRPPRLDDGRDAAARIVGEALAREMVQDRPLAIITGMN